MSESTQPNSQQQEYEKVMSHYWKDVEESKRLRDEVAVENERSRIIMDRLEAILPALEKLAESQD